MKTADFLLEIGVEEVPDWAMVLLIDLQARLLDVLAQGVQLECERHATPRRMVVVVRGVHEKEADTTETVTGPPVSAGLNAAQGFGRKMGVEVERLKKTLTPRGEYYSYTRKVKGRRTIEVLSQSLLGTILGISGPKAMTWTGKSGPRFIRPIRWIVALYGGKVVPFELAGVKADRFTYGHRRLAAEKRIRVKDFEGLREGLRRNFVLLDATERHERIVQGIAQLGVRARLDESLLETLVNITEFPTPIVGSFDPGFLALPEEVLVTVMQHHQKYFPVEDEHGKLAPQFVAVMNIDADPDGIVRHGNERVLKARFSDAKFFWETDQKRPLRDRVEDLKHIVFHAKLGSYYEKSCRNVLLVQALDGDAAAQRAAELAKCDLTTELVKEFTELQGVVGGLYARAQGEPEEVALAIHDQYQPVPSTKTGKIVALADRLDTLNSFAQLGLLPTGSKDPFALRRAALGVVRILIEGREAYSLSQLAPSRELREFILERLRYYLREVCRYSYDEVTAVLAAGADDVVDAYARLDALSEVRRTPNFEPLATSFRRIKNILQQAGHQATEPADPDVLEPGPERELYEEYRRVQSKARELAYPDALKAIASLRPHVDLFFDKVLVNDPRPDVRKNRLNFLAQLLREFSTIADFSEIVISGEQQK
ncbi:MAG: glycine--tRNA ligase subunit beta [Acidobacteria bacterium]|nr:glycine--tRNA ligase subunit beta [Acidobacteriota bacterium]